MDDEFALCWNNFQENIASGFQSLFDRGDLVDVTLACDGKLLQAHKIVLAICSPYFQDMFVTNPCRHPIIILKDVSHTVMSELLQFMYQGEVNVKHAELSSFMKIAQALQIKGLATSSNQPQPHQNRATSSPQISASSPHGGAIAQKISGTSGVAENFPMIDGKLNTGLYTSNASAALTSSGALKRANDYLNGPGNDSLPGYPKKLIKRASENAEHDISGESMENLNSDEVFMPSIPQISMVESNRFDLINVKREANEVIGGPAANRSHLPAQFNFENNGTYNKNVEYPNELHMSNDLLKSTGGSGNGSSHGDIQTGGNITMLSSTSLLHGNCIFNRNNTVATQQGMKTYWLCKSYRITMCRARCITHQGRVISATGVHNHQPHMKGSSTYPPSDTSYVSTNCPTGSGSSTSAGSMRLSVPTQNQTSNAQHTGGSHLSQQPHQLHGLQQSQGDSVQDHSLHHHSPSHGHHHHEHHVGPTSSTSSIQSSSNTLTLQNMVQSVLSPNGLLHSQILNPIHLHHHPHSTHSSHASHSAHSSPHLLAPAGLQITPIGNQNLQSPESPRTASAHAHHLTTQHQHGHSHAQHTHQQHPSQSLLHQQESPGLQHHHQTIGPSSVNNTNSTGSTQTVITGDVSSSPISPSQRQQQQHCDNLSPENESHSIASDSTIMSTISMAQSSFKMEQI